MEQREGRSPATEDLERAQITSRERVRNLAEVYTHEREVNAMLDLVPDMFPSAEDPGNADRTFLEPACGSGNFLAEILARKLAYVTPRLYGRGEGFEHRVLRCLVSIYGIDICEENVRKARERMTVVIDAHIGRYLRGDTPTPGFLSAMQAVLATNIICADTLADAAEIELIEYAPGTDGTFIREWSRLLDAATDERTLFSLIEARRDGFPVHYAELGCQPGPVVADLVGQEAA